MISLRRKRRGILMVLILSMLYALTASFLLKEVEVRPRIAWRLPEDTDGMTPPNAVFSPNSRWLATAGVNGMTGPLGLPHRTAVQLMSIGSPGQSDPDLIAVFARCAPQFERIFKEVRECPSLSRPKALHRRIGVTLAKNAWHSTTSPALPAVHAVIPCRGRLDNLVVPAPSTIFCHACPFF